MGSEIWKPVTGYEEYYEVSSTGVVRRLRFTNNIVDKLYDEPRILKLRIGSHGYPEAYLRRDGKAKAVLIHKIVAESFIGPMPEGLEVGHLDGNVTNSHWRNLAYITHAENLRHKGYHAKIARLSETVAKLRAALERIASCTPVIDGDCPSIARKALAETEAAPIEGKREKECT